VQGDTVLLRQNLVELWECVAFNPGTRKYLIGSRNEHGATATLRGLVYLDEPGTTFQDTAFGEQEFEAVAAQISQDARYFSFIACTDLRPRGGLYVMDTDINRIVYLGDPPAPPPGPKDSWSWALQSYTDLELGILSFTGPHSLQATFGTDSFKQREKKRKIKAWDLREAFSAPEQNRKQNGQGT
jgi:hypothetical protein